MSVRLKPDTTGGGVRLQADRCVIRSTLAEIEHERRVGYAWVGDWPRALVATEYPAWKAAGPRR